VVSILSSSQSHPHSWKRDLSNFRSLLHDPSSGLAKVLGLASEWIFAACVLVKLPLVTRTVGSRLPLLSLLPTGLILTSMFPQDIINVVGIQS